MHPALNLWWSFQLFSLFFFSFISFLFVYSCGYLGLWLCGWSILRWNLGFVELGGLWSPLCVFCVYLCFVIGGVLGFVNIFCWCSCLRIYVWLFGWHGEIVFWIYVLVCTYLCLVSFPLFCIFGLGCGPLAPNEDIVRFRWGPHHISFLHIFLWKCFHFCIVFLGLVVVCALFIGFWSLIAWLLVCI